MEMVMAKPLTLHQEVEVLQLVYSHLEGKQEAEPHQVKEKMQEPNLRQEQVGVHVDLVK